MITCESCHGTAKLHPHTTDSYGFCTLCSCPKFVATTPDLIIHNKELTLYSSATSQECARCRRVKFNKEFKGTVPYKFKFCSGCRQEIKTLNSIAAQELKFIESVEEYEDEDYQELSEEEEYKLQVIHDTLAELDG